MTSTANACGQLTNVETNQSNKVNRQIVASMAMLNRVRKTDVFIYQLMDLEPSASTNRVHHLD